MELLNSEEIHSICGDINGPSKAISWSVEDYSDELIGYLGEHHRLKIEVDSNSGKSQLNLFVKCMPRRNLWLANYLKELSFFKKEYVMLSCLFRRFKSTDEDSRKWRPKLYFIREDLFVFEDVAELGYRMPCHRFVLSYAEIMATVKTVAQFHAQSFILEENTSKELNKDYRIWEDFSEYLEDPPQGQAWRDTGRNAVIDYLKVYSGHKSKSNFSQNIDTIIGKLFQEATILMKPSRNYRNAVIHRDLWTNNIFIKKQDNRFHALLVDFQTVLYASPMLDISSLLFFNTTRSFRNAYTADVLRYYYEVLASELISEGIDVDAICNKTVLNKAFEESITFGITQAALIVPITAMDAVTRKKMYTNPETSAKINTVTRSAEFIAAARHDENYRNRVTELFDEIVDRFIYPERSA